MLKIYNSLSRQIEEIKPIHSGEIGMYACGPTVYDFTHIGHGRKYVNDDILRRVLVVIEELKVTHVQNVTDVGHLVSDSDTGEDKMEKGAKKAGKTVWEVAEEFTEYFRKTMKDLNVLPPTVECKATDHIQEQINLIKTILEKGHAYETDEAVYFDVSSFPDYGQLFGQTLDEKLVGARDEVETETLKRNPADFALWFKRVGKFADHSMYWPSPWGDGFPGWHIECSAMSMKYLGEQFEIHTGGEDHLSIHHPNEIAQSESATGKKPFVKYWFHSIFLMVDGKKMGKSLGNYLRVEDVVAKGFSALALRYYFLSTHYRKQMNFTWEGLNSAQSALNRLNELVGNLTGEIEPDGWSAEGEGYYKKFVAAVEDDLNTPQALAAIWEMMKSDISDQAKKNLIAIFNQVLGLELGTIEEVEIPVEIKELMKEREKAKEVKDYAASDVIREQINAAGYQIKDAPEGTTVVKK
ncbi:MAG: cysteinyl-tRNA synthetase, cysteinyl-tRNA synthetase [Candidatus Collierbacteria bacterium GW2011_GWC1_45_47]|uniref:Cysteine--tRNA ligase n=5 Tax=Candidatus Collieribacteriota TaxID=1752725 RepID=A0A0G1JSH5_9BACT|nr:MAG: Cysteine-tRNA ligase [Candidatus Collierbacteria bacterium GW2011_GWA1_44_12]KKT46857.1 MAG: Cysteine-tRNA ligase [Candidatus Collierbacteria bacterium GW2011_GWF2_44_15]KKT68020.1 MAG: Cysteine-tRNA ligase [Candidatus Collierbacteria bacterium GW2011_GWB1_44_35]KKT99050.1 MAG: Cysteine-tRNA ligase [Candidatus Collierbacteria bacterium GW2011_GWC2_45_15]KKU09612.1 MAG: cysteinyl-tRNA synthetase, cysteinyl-tRNA synthetase [Candidatus Collierbacteria bacterium GW2011_GWC1_45_47]KKU30494.